MRWLAVGQDEVGVIAVGQQATGVIAVGQFATGVVAIGQLSRGVVVLGQLAVGAVAVGQLAVGLVWCAAMLGVGGTGGPLLVLGALGDASPRRRRWDRPRHGWGWRLPLLVAVAGLVVVVALVPLVRELWGSGGPSEPPPLR